MLSDPEKSPVTITTLGPSCLRVVYRHSPGPVEYFGVAIDAGSRDEQPGEEGLAHFVEHTIFKGTNRRRSWHIINRMESVGGELNAYTTKEETMVYTVAPAGNLERAADLVADLVTSSVFPEPELEKEREVVIDEINSYLDTPSDSVFDDFDDLYFKDTPLGHNILGTVETVRGFTSADCRRWLDRCYVPSRMVVFYMGPLPVSKTVRQIEKAFSGLSGHQSPIPFSRGKIQVDCYKPFDILRSQNNHQAHTVMGAPIPGLYSNQRNVIALVNNILGGPGMNSLLNIDLRERRGLVYSSDSSTALYTDAGVLSIYFGCDPDDVVRCKDIICRILRRLPSLVDNRRFIERAKCQYAGQLVVAAENREQLALSTARTVLRDLPVLEISKIIRHVMDIRVEEVVDFVPTLLPENFSSLTLA